MTVGVRVKGGYDNKHEKAIIVAINKECELGRWCYVVEKTLEYFYINGKDEFIRAKYFHRLKPHQVCRVCHISERTFYRWQDEVLSIAQKWARIYKVIED